MKKNKEISVSPLKMEEEIKEEIEFLKYCSEQYETTGSSPISDKEWDRRYDSLKERAPNDPYFTEVGGLPERLSSNLKKVRHLKVMGSLNKSKNSEEFGQWFENAYGSKELKERFEEINYGFLMQPKVDGIAVTLIYAFGKFQMAVTRGNGEIGVDVTNNAMMVDGVLETIPYKSVMFEIRGEIYKETSDFYENWAGEYSHPRNFAAGTMNLDSPKEVQKRGLSFVAYEILGLPFVSEILKLNFLNQVGFNTLLPYTKATVGFKEIEYQVKTYMESVESQKDKLPFAIDGVVIKINDLKTKEEFGYEREGKVPKANRAVKFTTEQKETVLLDIEWNTSRKGRVIPTGVYEPIELLGSINNRVTLNNLKFVKANNCFIGSKILIEKGGEIIPHFVGVVEKSSKELELPKNCPSCGDELIIKGVDLFCDNENCSAKILKSIVYWFSEIGVDGMGDATVQKFIELGATSISDCYKLLVDTEMRAQVKQHLGDGVFHNVFQSVFRNSKIQLSNFIKGLGISKIGSMVNRVIEKFRITSMEQIDELTRSQINDIHGFGVGKTDSFIRGWSSKRQEILNILRYVDIIYPTFAGPLFGLNFVVTGTFKNPTRKEIETMLKDKGANVGSSVSVKTHFVIWDGEIASSKYKKALKLGKPIILPQEIMKVLKSEEERNAK